MIYYLLDEPFSAYTGLALANSVANMMRFEEKSVVVCHEADNTWGFGADRILLIPQISALFKKRGWRFLPPWIVGPIVRQIFGPMLSRLVSGDIVWCQNWAHVAWALESAIHAAGAKLIYHAQNSLTIFKKGSVFRSFTPDAFIFNSEAMRQEALTLYPHLKNTFTVHNGADETLFHPGPAGIARVSAVPVVLYVGRLVPQKGVHVLIEAMRILHARNIAVRCKLVGSSHAGGPKSKPTDYVASLHEQCPPNVEFEGFRSGTDIAEEYRSADILCCPSIWQEPFGNVNIEAMACGVPVVASRVGGIPEIAAEGGVLLVEPNSAADLADGLQKLILDEDLRERMSVQGLASFRRRFRWSVIVGQHREIAAAL
jgi:spore coat protein SA